MAVPHVAGTVALILGDEAARRRTRRPRRSRSGSSAPRRDLGAPGLRPALRLGPAERGAPRRRRSQLHGRPAATPAGVAELRYRSSGRSAPSRARGARPCSARCRAGSASRPSCPCCRPRSGRRSAPRRRRGSRRPARPGARTCATFTPDASRPLRRPRRAIASTSSLRVDRVLDVARAPRAAPRAAATAARARRRSRRRATRRSCFASSAACADRLAWRSPSRQFRPRCERTSNLLVGSLCARCGPHGRRSPPSRASRSGSGAQAS